MQQISPKDADDKSFDENPPPLFSTESNSNCNNHFRAGDSSSIESFPMPTRIESC
ncbi:MAG: hypothetical protein H7Z37_15715 [Pyrinomonadaceae bacterium]|nr:hypothetical protein [Pyrinomonadaceae bacterium]